MNNPGVVSVNYITTDNLRADLNILAPYHGTKITQLPDQANEAMHRIINHLRDAYDSGDQVGYTSAMSVVSDNFNHTSAPSPGTVHGFFMACYAEPPNSNIPVGCAPACLSSMSEEMVGGGALVNCEDGVLVYAKGKLSLLNDKLTTHCYLHCRDERYDPRTHQADIKMLMERGVERITVSYHNGTSTEEYHLASIQNYCAAESTGLSWWWLLFLLVLLLVVVVGLLLWARKDKA